MQQPCLQLDSVSRHFGGLRAVDEVTLSVPPGARHVVIGPNGAGKTTLFNLISGDLRPSGGSVVLDGTDVTRLKPHQRAARGISRTFQITKLFHDLTVLDNALVAVVAASGARFTMHKPTAACPELIERASSLLEQFDLSSLLHERARFLSYGDQRRLEVALALAGHPRLLLLDEPMAGLSSPERVRMRTLLEGLASSLTVLLIEHDIDIAFSFAQRITVLQQGRVLAEGSRDEVVANAFVQQAYLGK